MLPGALHEELEPVKLFHGTQGQHQDDEEDGGDHDSHLGPGSQAVGHLGCHCVPVAGGGVFLFRRAVGSVRVGFVQGLFGSEACEEGMVE